MNVFSWRGTAAAIIGLYMAATPIPVAASEKNNRKWQTVYEIKKDDGSSLRRQIKISTIKYDSKKSWIKFKERLQRYSNADKSARSYKPYKAKVDCSDGYYHATFGGDEKLYTKRGNQWFIDFVNRNDPTDKLSVKVKPDEDEYPGGVYSYICSNTRKYK